VMGGCDGAYGALPVKRGWVTIALS
jgi:hypothetical protein